MKKFKEKIDSAVSKVLAARAGLRTAQAEARAVLLEIMSEKKEVAFKPSSNWKADIEAGREHALANALDEEGVDSISFTNDNMEPRVGRVNSVRLDESGAVVIEVQDIATEELVDIREDNTGDADTLLEFVRIFGSQE